MALVDPLIPLTRDAVNCDPFSKPYIVLVVNNMQRFSIEQLNNLITGNTLSCEILTSQENIRSFLTVSAVTSHRYINTADPSSMVFWLRKYEVPAEYIENDWDVSDDELINSIHIKEIVGIAGLEEIVNKYLNNIQLLDVEWKCDNPL